MLSAGGKGGGRITWYGTCNVAGLSDEGVGQFTNGDAASFYGWAGPYAQPNLSVSWTVSGIRLRSAAEAGHAVEVVE